VRPSKRVWQELETADDLYFQLLNTDKNFNAYTEMPIVQNAHSLVYITNATTQPQSQTTPNIITYSPLQFSVDTVSVNTVVIKNAQGTCIFEAATSSVLQVNINLNRFGTGRYELWLDGILSKSFFGTSERLHPQCYGILQIQTSNCLEVLKLDTLPSLTLNFESRAVYWKYLIVIPSDKNISISTIDIDNDAYTPPETQTVFNDKTAYAFTSRQPIKLIKSPQHYDVLKLQYTQQFSDSPIEQDMKLPVPAAHTLQKEEKNNAHSYYAQSIIYV
jgi:hypothetical protein